MHTFSEFQQLHEVMQQPQPWKWRLQRATMYTAVFQTSNGSSYTVYIGHKHEGMWRVDFVDQEGETKITGAGQPFEVFATVMNIMREFIVVEENITAITFDTVSFEGSRISLYERMARKYKPDNWTLEVSKDNKLSISFILRPKES